MALMGKNIFRLLAAAINEAVTVSQKILSVHDRFR